MVTKILKISLCGLLLMGSMQAAQNPGDELYDRLLAAITSDDYNDASIDQCLPGGGAEFVKKCEDYVTRLDGDDFGECEVELNHQGQVVVGAVAFYQQCADLMNEIFSYASLSEAFTRHADRYAYFRLKIDSWQEQLDAFVDFSKAHDELEERHGRPPLVIIPFAAEPLADPAAPVAADSDVDYGDGASDVHSNYGDSTDDEGLEGNPL
jgi:hypothetical protein